MFVTYITSDVMDNQKKEPSLYGKSLAEVNKMMAFLKRFQFFTTIPPWIPLKYITESELGISVLKITGKF